VDKGPIKTLNPNLRGLGHSATVAINEHSNRLLAEGKEVFKLGLGQSPFPIPERITEALRQNAHQKDYLPVKGLQALREAVVAYHNRSEGLHYSPEHVLVGPGSKELMFLLQLAYDGDLMVPAPSWVSYEPQARIVGRRTTWIMTNRSDGWRLSAEGLDAVCTNEGERPRLLILNYPSNPTGATFDEDGLKAIAEVARRHRLILLSDEIYGEVHHRGEHISVARFYPEGTIISSGLSKWCGAGGWRLGHFAFPESLSWLCEAMAAAASETFTSTSAPIQHAAVSAFEEDPALAEYLTRSRRVLGSLSSWCQGRIESVGGDCADPSGGFYLFPDFTGLREALKSRGITSSPQLCEALLEETGVAVLPGSVFGRPANELTLRLAYVDFDGDRALEAVGDVSGLAGEAFLRAHCPRVVTAIDRMCDWLSS
jgi:aspartate aminotransferase